MSTTTPATTDIYLDSITAHIDTYRAGVAGSLARLKSAQRDENDEAVALWTAELHKWTTQLESAESILGSARDALAGR